MVEADTAPHWSSSCKDSAGAQPMYTDSSSPTDVHDRTSRMLFRIDPNPEETRRACRAIVAASAPPSRATPIVIAVYVAVIGAAFLLTPQTAARTVIIAVGAILLVSFGVQADSRARLRRVQAADPHARETHSVELGPDGVRTWCAHVDSRYTWDGTTRVLETPEFYLFVRNAGNGVAIPKRVVSAAEDQELRRRVREWLSPDIVELADAHPAPLEHAR